MRFYDKVGYGIPTYLGDDVWSDNIIERAYYGEVLSVSRSAPESDKVNDDVSLSNRIRIFADAFALQNFAHIKYVSWAGALWTVTSVEVESPRLILSLGGAWNGKRPTS